ncbi:hypothetical protein Salat_0659300 [Sesamum alatum]|uniref:Uncharacterized protein n=1 Tax=Sesamum alatum TaxID=300844 RepID=A0AAE1YS01_9LAMI|nr:hypothetical protein Salat_0659300 [Sesamum alatum]
MPLPKTNLTAAPLQFGLLAFSIPHPFTAPNYRASITSFTFQTVASGDGGTLTDAFPKSPTQTKRRTKMEHCESPMSNVTSAYGDMKVSRNGALTVQVLPSRKNSSLHKANPPPLLLRRGYRHCYTCHTAQLQRLLTAAKRRQRPPPPIHFANAALAMPPRSVAFAQPLPFYHR